MTLNLTVLDRGLALTPITKELPALTNGHDITLLHLKAGRAVSGDVAMSLLVTSHHARDTHLPSVLLDVSQVVTTHDDGALHLRGDHQTLEDGAANRHGGSERALLVDVLSANRELGRLDAETNIGVPTLIGLLAEDVHLAVGELILLLVGSLVLQSS